MHYNSRFGCLNAFRLVPFFILLYKLLYWPKFTSDYCSTQRSNHTKILSWIETLLLIYNFKNFTKKEKEKKIAGHPFHPGHHGSTGPFSDSSGMVINTLQVAEILFDRHLTFDTGSKKTLDQAYFSFKK